MAKKRIIINRGQFRKLNEVDLSVAAPENTNTSYSTSLNNGTTRNDLQALKNAGGDPGAIVSGPNTTDQSPTVDVNVPMGTTASDALNEPSISAAIKNGASARIHGDGFPMEETITYHKKALEEMRLNNMKKNGKIYTKKSLMESMFSPVLSAVEWGDSLKKYLNEFISNISNDQELQNYLMQGGDFSTCLQETMKTAKQLLMNLDELSNARH